MNLLYPVKCDGEFYPAGPYKGGLPGKVEADLKAKGYFDAEPTESLETDSGDDNSGLTLKEISKLSLEKLNAIIGDLTEDELNELVVLEEAKGDKSRSGAVDALNDALVKLTEAQD